MKKTIAILSTLAFAMSVSAVSAAKLNYAPELPENDGTYDVLGHPDMKVKIFVHKNKPVKPALAPEGVVGICSSDEPSDASVGATGWKLPSSWNYRLNVSTVPASIGATGLGNIANLSFDEWYGNLPGMSIIKGDSTKKYKATFDGQNIIAWGNAPATALAITYTWYYTNSGVVAENDTIMNKKFAWSWNMCSAKSYDAQNILTHELGHWFGLTDHYKVNYDDNTMYGYGSVAENKKDTLTSGDIIGLQQIYQ
ncbi:MAG: matrixin family metalloprotease [Parcubacteria group bacterium]|jgi:hypothetical protein